MHNFSIMTLTRDQTSVSLSLDIRSDIYIYIYSLETIQAKDMCELCKSVSFEHTLKLQELDSPITYKTAGS